MPSSGEPIEAPTILIVDDDPTVTRALARIARELGYDAATATSVEEARVLAEEIDFQVIASDWVQGDETSNRWIQALTERSQDLVLLLVTAAQDVSEFRSRFDHRIVSILAKPIRWGEAQEALARALELNATRSTRSSNVTAPPRTLIVEDSPTDALLLSHTLDAVDGVKPDVVTRLSEALERVHEIEYDTIFTDLSLPDGRGLDAVVRLRSAAPNATLIVCSGSDDEALAFQVVDRGAQDFILKQSMTPTGLRRTLGIARARRTAELRLARLAFYDGLTGLANRTSLYDGLMKMTALARRDQLRFGVLFMDLDGFKSINDRYGHEAGDTVLRATAERLREEVRDYDIVARLGGDEFVVAVSHVDTVKLLPLAERIRASVTQPIFDRGQELQVAISIGYALFPEAGEDVSTLLRGADAAMYEAKRAGPNRIHAAEPALGPMTRVPRTR